MIFTNTLDNQIGSPDSISSLVEKLCKNYGPKICDVNGVAYHAFPNFDELMDPKVCNGIYSFLFEFQSDRKSNFQVEQELRNESFGYRAKFIQRAATEINDKGGLEWFQKVQNMEYKDAHTELITLTGIGPKVSNTKSGLLKHFEKRYD